MGRDMKEGMEVCDRSIPIYIYKWARVRQPTIPNFPYIPLLSSYIKANPTNHLSHSSSLHLEIKDNISE
ncbi:hypothetical protein COP2_003174 [Malus domestica]